VSILVPGSAGKQVPKAKLVDQHGTYSRYVGRGCRCLLCKEARADYMRDYRARKQATTVTRVHYCPTCTCERPAGDS